ncbi:protein of unknown function [Salinibacillus kushneri]|uniref:DnaJ homologue subfamily C member 28 conserved domain-containing protein n=1 Tax=Salinibacillus kushneri TaxID=237682 RepID=A0A1I0GSW3_9BACI|nr:DUF1992 domain-containing protein [Salinibacillus kushneri]SET73433.1 protein of unknown function [Salinibacillus kushneri]
MDIGYILAEEKIKSALDKGELDNLPGKGKPLPKDDLAGMSEDLRTSYRMMKNAGVLPEEMKIKKEMVTLEELINQTQDEKEIEEYKEKLTEKHIHYQSLMDKRRLSSSPAYPKYRGKIQKRFGIR